MVGLIFVFFFVEWCVYLFWCEMWWCYSCYKFVVVSVVLLFILVFVVVVGFFLWCIKINEIDIVVGMQGLLFVYFFGIDDFGQDILVCMIYGGCILFVVGFVVMLVFVFIGMLIGVFVGMLCGVFGYVLMWFIDLFLFLL